MIADESGGGENAAPETIEPRGVAPPASHCPYDLGRRLERARHTVETLRLKIEGLALLGDVLGERLAAARAPTSCRVGEGVCRESACALAEQLTAYDDAFDRIAQRVAALQQAIETARRLGEAGDDGP